MIKIRTAGIRQPRAMPTRPVKNSALNSVSTDGYQAVVVSTGRGIELRVKITSIQMSMAHGEIFSANCSFESIGAPCRVQPVSHGKRRRDLSRKRRRDRI